MNLIELYQFIKFLEDRIKGKVTLGITEFGGLQIRIFWFYKEKALQWQYVISFLEMNMVKDNSSFIPYLIEKAKAEYQRKTWEIDTDDRT